MSNFKFKFQISNFEFNISNFNFKFQISNDKFEICHLKLEIEIWNLKFEIWNFKYEISNLKYLMYTGARAHIAPRLRRGHAPWGSLLHQAARLSWGLPHSLPAPSIPPTKQNKTQVQIRSYYSILLYFTLLYSILFYSTLFYSSLFYSTLLYSTLGIDIDIGIGIGIGIGISIGIGICIGIGLGIGICIGIGFGIGIAIVLCCIVFLRPAKKCGGTSNPTGSRRKPQWSTSTRWPSGSTNNGPRRILGVARWTKASTRLSNLKFEFHI